ncbi:hypothetical protein NESM_000785500 [Novymonas esmeraldas]|uniref:Uncharacterized protein n=1 Tax=Novymonas esmeraldas TaxID=1808958 RepID=A0AAW0EVI9_9TRYP
MSQQPQDPPHGRSGPSASPHSHTQRPYGAAAANSGSAGAWGAPPPRRGGFMDGRGRGYGPRQHSAGGGDRRPFHAALGPGGGMLPPASLMEDAPRTKLSSYVTPHDAVQAQPAQHGATVVRSGSAATEGGSILFFSSVQKKGGAFTATERETYAQLHRSRAIPNVNRGRNAGNASGSGVSARSVARQYADLEKDREAVALAQATTAVAGAKRTRFALPASSSSSSEAESEREEEDSDGEERHGEAPLKRRLAD